MGKLIENVLTPVTKEHLVYMLNEGWKELYGSYPSHDSLAILWSQVRLETGGAFCHCWNLGNVKFHGDYDYCMYRCNEIINGKEEWFDPPHKQTWFLAFSTDIEGAKEYIKFISQRKRYQKAWQAVMKGDPAAYAHELKVAGYYTASEQLYTTGIIRLTEQFKKYAAATVSSDRSIPKIPPLDVPKLPDIDDIELIKFDWSSELHSEAEESETLQLSFVEKIVSLILNLFKVFLGNKIK